VRNDILYHPAISTQSLSHLIICGTIMQSVPTLFSQYAIFFSFSSATHRYWISYIINSL